jgi:hypothetical protein
VGNSVARSLVSCSGGEPNGQKVKEGACYGDYANLDINLALNAQQAIGLVAGILSLGCAQIPTPSPVCSGVPDLPFAAAKAGPDAKKAVPDPLKKLPDLVGGLLPGASSKSPSPDSGSSGTASDEQAPPVVCKLTGMCRTPAASYAKAQKTDVGRLLVGPAVAR